MKYNYETGEIQCESLTKCESEVTHHNVLLSTNEAKEQILFSQLESRVKCSTLAVLS